MFIEHDVVVATKDLQGISKGTLGAIVFIYEDNKTFEVEFVDESRDTISVLTVDELDIEKK